jgi:tetratricopeptide (TPR) repeat protein
MKIKKLLLITFLLTYAFESQAAINVSEIKINMANLETLKDKDAGLAKCEELIREIDLAEENEKAHSAEFYTWKGIVTAKMAQYKKSLTLAKEARSYLEKSVEIDEKNSDAAALNALGILYHRVPRFIAFGDNKKAEEYFKRAIQISSNVDTNWRYGEFLIDTGKKEKGLELLKAALSKVNPAKSEEKIKAKIIQELVKKYEKE